MTSVALALATASQTKLPGITVRENLPVEIRSTKNTEAQLTCVQGDSISLARMSQDFRLRDGQQGQSGLPSVTGRLQASVLSFRNVQHATVPRGIEH